MKKSVHVHTDQSQKDYTPSEPRIILVTDKVLDPKTANGDDEQIDADHVSAMEIDTHEVGGNR